MTRRPRPGPRDPDEEPTRTPAQRRRWATQQRRALASARRHDEGRCGGPPACTHCVEQGRSRAPRPGEGKPQVGERGLVRLTLPPELWAHLDALALEAGGRSAALRELLRADLERGRPPAGG